MGWVSNRQKKVSQQRTAALNFLEREERHEKKNKLFYDNIRITIFGKFVFRMRVGCAGQQCSEGKRSARRMRKANRDKTAMWKRRAKSLKGCLTFP